MAVRGKVNRKSCTTALKYAEGAMRLAQDKNLLSEFLFYYQIKSINVQGQFSLKVIFKLIAERTNQTPNHIRKMIDRLVVAGFIRKNGGLFELVSYDLFWSILGLDLSLNQKKKRKGSFLILKLHPTSSKENLIDQIALAEYQRNQELQKRVAIKKLRKDKYYQNDTAKKTRKGRTKEEILNGIVQKHLVSSLVEKSLREQFIVSREQYENPEAGKNFCNADINIGCKGFAKLLGYKTASQGWNIQQRLKKAGLIEIENRIYTEFMTETEYVSKGFNRVPSCRRDPITGVVTFQLTNKITVL